MKQSILRPRLLSIAMVLLAAGSLSSPAADGTWISTTNSIWSDTTNWLGGVVANGAGNTATFSNELAAPVEVNLDSARTIGNLNFVHTGFSITNNGADSTNILTLDRGASRPLVSVPASATATIRRTVLAGTNGFVLDGGGQLNLFKENSNSNNLITGGIVLSNGTLQVQGINVNNSLNTANTLTLSGAGPISFINGTLNIRPAANTSPSYGNVSNDLVVPDGGIGTIVLPVRFSGVAGDGAAAGSGLGGALTGSGTFNVNTLYVRGNVVGNWSAFTGQINVTPGSGAVDNEWRFGNAAGFPNASVNLGGTSPLAMNYYPSPAADGSTVIPVGVLSADNVASYVTGSRLVNRTLTYRVGAKLTNAADVATFAGQLRNVASGVNPNQRLAIIKEGVGTWVLTGTNNYTGGTIISNGVLQIGDGFSESGSIGSGPVVNYGKLVISRGGALTIPGDISGPGSLTNNGIDSTITLTGTNTYTGSTIVAGGKLVVGTTATLTGGCAIGDGASLGALVTRAGSSLGLGNISFGSGCSFDVDLSTFGNPTATVASSAGAVSLNGNVTVNVAGRIFDLSPGAVTLLQYASRSGTGNFVLGTLPGSVTASLNDDTANKRVTLVITAVINPTLRWVGDAVGNWDALNPLNRVWQVIGTGQVTNYYDGAFVRFDDTATGTTNINLVTTLLPSAVTVSNSIKQYTFGGLGWVSGTAELTKRGDGKLTVLTANDFTGTTTIEAGTLQLGNGGDVGQLGTGNIVNNGVLVVNRTNAVTVAGDITGSGSVTVIGDGTTNSAFTFTPSSVAGSSYSGGTTVSNAVVIMGSGPANGLNTAGTGLGTGPVTFYGTNGLYLFQSSAGGGGSSTGDAGYDFGLTLNVPAGQTLDYQVPPRSAERTILTGAGTVSLRAAGIRCYVLGGDWSQFTGRIIFYGNAGAADLRLNSSNDLPLARVLLANTDGLGNIARMMNQGDGQLRYRIGELSGDPGSEINANNGDGGDAPASTVWVVGGLNTDATFAGTTGDPGNADHSFVKEGTGRWTMSGTNNHQGFTTVSNGVLALVGEAGLSNSVTVTTVAPGILDASGRTDPTLWLGTAANVQTLAGNGTVRGSVVLGANGRLAPGFSTGVLTVTNAVTLGGSNVFELDTAASPNSDRLVAANITYGGALILTNIGSSLNGTNTFQLFSGALSGTFANVITQAISGVTWDLSKLNVNGSITLIGPAGPSTSPPGLGFSLSGNSLNLSWPASHLGWQLQVQTNSTAVGLSNNWASIPGSTATNSFTVVSDPTRGAVFYRLVYPPQP